MIKLNYKFKSNVKRDAKKSEWVKMRFDLVKEIFGDLVIEWWSNQWWCDWVIEWTVIGDRWWF